MIKTKKKSDKTKKPQKQTPYPGNKKEISPVDLALVAAALISEEKKIRLGSKEFRDWMRGPIVNGYMSKAHSLIKSAECFLNPNKEKDFVSVATLKKCMKKKRKVSLDLLPISIRERYKVPFFQPSHLMEKKIYLEGGLTLEEAKCALDDLTRDMTLRRGARR